MNINQDYLIVSDLFEDTVKRAAQLASLAAVMQDAIVSPDSDPKALHDTAWLMSELLQVQHKAIAQLQDAHRKDYLSRQNR